MYRYFQNISVLCFLPILVVLAGCYSSETVPPPDSTPHDSDLVKMPAFFPPLPIPADNPLNAAKIALGRRLFYDGRLSVDNSISCGSCHKQEYAFTDGGSPVSKGVNGEAGFRNTPTIANSAYQPLYAFDGASHSLEEQILRAILNPAEMRADTSVISLRLQHDTDYVKLFKAAFGENAPVNTAQAAKAIGSFARTILSGNSRFDRYVQGNASLLNESEIRGLNLFLNVKVQCASCHRPYRFFTDNQFHNTGLYANYLDKGLFYTSHQQSDVGKFKTPTLRNIALTAPYMHDGSMNTLQEVLDHYNKGGVAHENKDTLIKPLNLTQQNMDDIIAFLRTLTDEELLNNPKFSKP